METSEMKPPCTHTMRWRRGGEPREKLWVNEKQIKQEIKCISVSKTFLAIFLVPPLMPCFGQSENRQHEQELEDRKVNSASQLAAEIDCLLFLQGVIIRAPKISCIGRDTEVRNITEEITSVFTCHFLNLKASSSQSQNRFTWRHS